MADIGDIILSKWLEGSLSQEELDQLTTEYDLSYLKSILDRQADLELNTIESAKLWHDFSSKQADISNKDPEKSPKVTASNRRRLILLSVLLLSGLLLALHFLKRPQKKITVRANKGEVLEYALIDGSKVYLSPESTITFDSTSWNSHRVINLDGQAYFEVEKGEPFTVQTDAGSINVLGTSFDVWEIDSKNLRVACTEGRVSVKNNSDVQRIITAGEGVDINDSILSGIISLDTERVYWIRGQKTYRSSKITWIIDDLERFYNIKIGISAELKEKQFSGVIPTQDLDKALLYLTKTMGWNYAINNKNITITSR